MPAFKIEIRFYPNDRFEYDPPLPKIDRRNYDSIRWKCRVDPAGSDKAPKAFAVHFHGASPCEKVRYRTTVSEMTSSLCLKLRGAARYKYFVAVVDDNNDVWTDDPDMIVFP